MRIAIVFSSPTPSTNEFENVWKKCPQCRMLAPDKLVIEGNDWKIFVFDGLEKQYHKVTWDYDRLSQEIFAIACQHPNSVMGILLHGDDPELKTLVQKAITFNIKCLLSKHYGSAKGRFYQQFVKPFSSGASDDLFRKLWDKLMDTPKEIQSDQEIGHEIDRIHHDFSSFARRIRFLIEDAEDNISQLQKFKKLDFEPLFQRYAAIESKLMSYNIDGLHDVPAEKEIITSTVRAFRYENPFPNNALILARSCLAATETITAALKKAWEVCHG